jgi:hypothetical protein
MTAGGGRIPADALRGYGVNASLMSSWLHGGGIHIECSPPGCGAGDAAVTGVSYW